MLKQLKQLIPVSLKSRVLHLMRSSASEEFDRFRGMRKAIVALAADYGNLGDVAITLAQGQFLESCLPGHAILFFPCAATFTQMKALKRVCTQDDLITIVGGGNMSDMYASLEDARRFIVEQFPKNRIISFPQTMDFSPSRKGRAELVASRKVYSRHRSLHLIARESVTYQAMQAAFPGVSVHLAPDIVLSSSVAMPERRRSGVLLCIRSDWESGFKEADRSLYMERMQSSLPEATVTDTVIAGEERLPVLERQAQLQELLDRFGSAEVVVTDRLHGMIFCAITGTPCVVLENSNHKVRATHAGWLQGLTYVRMQEGFDPSRTLELIEELRLPRPKAVILPNLGQRFDALRETVACLR